MKAFSSNKIFLNFNHGEKQKGGDLVFRPFPDNVVAGTYPYWLEFNLFKRAIFPKFKCLTRRRN